MLILADLICSIENQAPAATMADKADDAKGKAKMILTIDPLTYVHIKQAVSTFVLLSTLKNTSNDYS